MSFSSGRIQYAKQDQTIVLKFLGDVRLTLCTTLDSAIERIFTDNDFSNIVIDLTETNGIDSTSLGLLAKISILCRRQTGMLPTLISTNTDITRLLHSMGFEKVFNLLAQPFPCPEMMKDLPEQEKTEEVVRSKVLEAHKILMSLNESNRQAFKDLVGTLEQC